MANKFFIFIITLYRKFISPLFVPVCRFTPTCSEYSMQAFEKYNFFKALFLSIKRILKCNQFFKGGYDPLK
ncbi:MAG: membrane protein insertion efficiency factor YidD [bacterium (Candidatus Stahlbacteria) CG23_combo_of_CG06-09_8_20_14_all_34_7]|nr:MAG: membrane protein insertion efficiency factor YidD [bacterium (Candidatus Stahlbacteria) CG23_combo_of_CG06-09_8_20_14_all_34_7]